jgi:hypothetical protein
MISLSKFSAWALVLLAFGQHAMAVEESLPARHEFAPAIGGQGTVHDVASWAVASGDNQNLPFVVVDKIASTLFVFDAQGTVQASTPVLLGLTRGDHSMPGVGTRPIAQLRAVDRTTPAGRFVGTPGKNIHGEEIIWIDYDAALSIHRVRAGPPGERRLERLASSTTADNRISYGCVNVPLQFYHQVIAPTFARKGIVYILPETAAVQKSWGLAPRTRS